MTELDVALSRLLDGDLPPEEAAALQARIAAEPEVAAAWATMRQLVADLEALPALEAPPPLRRATPAPAPTRGGSWRAPLALAAAALVTLALWPATPVEITLPAGTLAVSGPAVVTAPDVAIAVDGRTVISVEPPGELTRDPRVSHEDPMNISHLLSAAAGAALTVTVIEGTATLTPDRGAPIALVAGDSHTLAARADTPPASARADTPERADAETARLRTRVAELERALAEARLLEAVHRGQVVASEGPPSPWPAEVPPGLDPASFTAAVEAATAGREVDVRFDCDEYPCVALLSTTAPGEDWQDALRDVPERLAETTGAGLVLFASRMENGTGDVGVLAFALGPKPDLSRDTDVGLRLHHRADSLTEELGRELLGE